MNSISRRHFHSIASSVATGAVVSSTLRAAPSDRLAVGFIGVGTMGRGHLGSFLGMNDIEVVAVCDVVKERTDSAANTVANHPNYKPAGKQAQKFDDYRKLLDLKGLDAVVIATPDHWHALQAVHAARAGKHIYCEKPLTRTIGEGRKVVEEVAKAGIVFQTGSQQRSEFGGHFRNAVERVRNGLIGKLEVIRIGVGVPPFLRKKRPKGPIGSAGWGLPPFGPTIRTFARRGCTGTSPLGVLTVNMLAVVWLTWEPTISTLRSGHSTWTNLAR